MALNFLKRKKRSQENVQLDRDSLIDKSEQESDAYLEEIFSISLKEPQQGSSACVNHNETKLKQELSSNDEIENFSPEEDVSDQNWNMGKNRIKKLMYDISDLLTSDDYCRKRLPKMIESHSDNKSIPKRQDSPSKSLPEQNKLPKKETLKLPLDIQELHNVAAMAKRLSARSRLKNKH